MRNTLLKVITLGFLVSSSPLSSFAHEVALELVGTEFQSGSQFKIDFRSVESVSGTCPLIVHRFEYFESVNEVVLEVKKDQPCFIDDFGVVTGSFFWKLPSTVMSRNGFTRILLNGASAGNIVSKNGTLAVVPSAVPSASL